MDSDEELFIENKVRLRNSFEQLILRYSNVSSQDIEEYDLNTGEGYIIPNPLDPSLRSISHNTEDLWNFPDFKDVIPEKSLADDDETNNISASNSDIEDTFPYENNSDSSLISNTITESHSEKEENSSESESSESESSGAYLNSISYKEKSNFKTEPIPENNEINFITLNEKNDYSRTTEYGSNSPSSEAVESDCEKEVLPLEAKLSDFGNSEAYLNNFSCKDELNIKSKQSLEFKHISSMKLNKEFEAHKDITPELTKRDLRQVGSNTNSNSSPKKHKSILEQSKIYASEVGLKAGNPPTEKVEEVDILDDIGPILVDWKLDISYSDSESSSDEKDTPSPTQGDRDEKDSRDFPSEDHLVKNLATAYAINSNTDKKQPFPNQILRIESTEKSSLSNDNKLEIEEKLGSTKRRAQRIAKIRGIDALKSTSRCSLPKIDQVDNNESKACDGIQCEKMFCLECDSLNS